MTIPTESLPARAARNFFVHSGHVPLVLLILEALLDDAGYFAHADPYVLLGAGILQAYVMEWWPARFRGMRFLANFVGPISYSFVEAWLEGIEFFQQWHHQVYWGFALGFALLHWARSRRPLPALVLTESVLRSSIPLVMYAVFEARTGDAAFSLRLFFADPAHDFLAIVLLLLGILLGIADLNLQRSIATIKSLTERLHQYSEWSLGRGILDRAIADESTLSLHRLTRAVLFMDIRGFTAWSEQQTPEAVVGMLNDYYLAAEAALEELRPIKLKYTADEVMAIFSNVTQAVEAGSRMLASTRPLLAHLNLSAGAGLHFGPVIEGVLGGEGAKAYDFIGDTVNTAKRLCDAAGADELLVSSDACVAAGISPLQHRNISAKGKRKPVQAAVVV